MMLGFRPLALLLVLPLLLAVDANTKNDNKKKLRPRIRSPHPDVIRELQDAPIAGGTTVTDPLKYPYFGHYSFIENFRERACGGALIAPDIVLTAGRCGVRNGREFRMLTTTRGVDGITRTITQTVIHPDYDDETFAWDFSVLKLSGNILVSETGDTTGARVIRMQSDRNIPEAEADQQIMGFGSTDIDTPDQPSDFLHEATLDSSDGTCGTLVDLDIMTCSTTMSVFPYSGACDGDFGGPQVDVTTVPHTVVGVTSFYVGSCGPLTVSARVSAALNWITTTACSMTSFPSDLCPALTSPPSTSLPVTSPPSTSPPVTSPPSTSPPATNPPSTSPPVTIPPSTIPPVTSPPSTSPPVTSPPSTNSPATVNDDCVGAISIQVGDTDIIGDTTMATPDGSQVPSFCDAASADTPGVWYTFIGTGSMVLAASTCDEDTSFDTALSVYMGSCDGLTCVVGNDETPTSCSVGNGFLSSRASFMAQAGVTYYILVRGYSTTGKFGLSLLNYDSCEGAIYIDVGDAGILGDTTMATPDSGAVPGFCGAASADDTDPPGVWYVFTGNGAMVVAASTCDEQTNFDTSVSVYEGSCDGLICVDGGNDDITGACGVGAFGLSSRVSFMAEFGVTYYILVRGYSGTGQFGLSLLDYDSCRGAIPIKVGDTDIIGDTSTATSDDRVVPSFCSGSATQPSPGVWYEFKGTGAMVVAASTCDEETTFDTVLSVYMGSCESLTCVAGSDDITLDGCTIGATQLSSRSSFMAQDEVTYYILVRGFNAAATGKFGLSLQEVQPPANDECSGAIDIKVGDPATIGDTASATPDNAAVPSFCGPNTDNFSSGVWYKIVGTGSMVLAASTCDEETQFATTVSVYKGSCGSLTCVAANEFVLEPDGCLVGAGDFSSSASFMAEAGVTYYILVYGFNGQAGKFGISLQEIESPPNDVCSGAIQISPGDTGIIGDTAFATPDNGAVPSFCGPTNAPVNFSPGVWYTFTGTGFPMVAASTCDKESQFDTLISVYQGSCNSLKCVTFNDDFAQEGNCLVGDAEQFSSEARFMAEAGVTYYILVYGFASTGGTFGLSLIRPPPNDECAFATQINVGDTDIVGDTTLAPPTGMLDNLCVANPTGIDSPGVWYTFIGNGAMVLAASTCDENTQFDSAISVYTGSCGNLVCLDGNDFIFDSSCTLGAQQRSSEVEFMAVAGVQYFILIHGWQGRSGRFGLDLTAASPTPAPTDSMAPTLSLYIDFSYISEFSFGFDQTLVDLPSDEDVMSLLRMTEVFYKRKVAESFSIPYQDVNVGDADLIQLTLEFIHSEVRDSRLFITFETKVTVRKRPGVPDAAQVESVLETFDSTTYLDDFVKVGGSVPFSFADSVLVTVSDNNNSR